MLVKFNGKEAELAAEKYYLVHNFLELRKLDCDRYYDAALDGFLNAVRNHCLNNDNSSFEEIAFKEMNLSCIEALSKNECESISLLGFDDYLENGLPIERAVTDTIDVAHEVINAFCFEEIMQSFNMSERRIAKLLLAGYTERSIARQLNMNLLNVFHSIDSIYSKISGKSLATVA